MMTALKRRKSRIRSLRSGWRRVQNQLGYSEQMSRKRGHGSQDLKG